MLRGQLHTSQLVSGFPIADIRTAHLGCHASAEVRSAPMAKSRIYALCGGMFALIAIGAVARHDVLPGIFVFLVAIGCGLRARNEWKREQA